METSEILDTSIAMTRDKGNISVFTCIEHPPSARKGFEVFFPGKEDYIFALVLAEKLRQAGKPLGCVDIMIAAMGFNRGMKIITKDKGFENVSLVMPELKIEFAEK